MSPVAAEEASGRRLALLGMTHNLDANIAPRVPWFRGFGPRGMRAQHGGEATKTLLHPIFCLLVGLIIFMIYSMASLFSSSMTIMMNIFMKNPLPSCIINTSYVIRTNSYICHQLIRQFVSHKLLDATRKTLKLTRGIVGRNEL